MPVLQQQFRHQSSVSHNKYRNAAYTNAAYANAAYANAACCVSCMTQKYCTQQHMSTEKTAPNTDSSLTNNMMSCIYYMSAYRDKQNVEGSFC